jgi:hypothetical protein
VLFSDEMSPKFEQLGGRANKHLLDSGFWKEVAKKFQEFNLEYNTQEPGI